ncbi:MAG: NUDIX domain-containing protein [Bacteroidales bacterium]|jgi:8-oxo-dGTP diphosphatase|nr:NUDIX domain-containing protein [Bacteroidales bacterium]
MIRVEFSESIKAGDPDPMYAVIAARHGQGWLFVRHYKRQTWEMPAGHIEPGEGIMEAARRELWEETGAVDPDPELVSVYSVAERTSKGYGCLFFAEVAALDPLPENSEICEVKVMERMPSSLTYPDIQPVMFEKVISWLRSKGRI